MYLDHNATSPPSPEVTRAVQEAQERFWANPFSQHQRGREAAMAMDRAREEVAALCQRAPHEVFFTSGATEANSWILSAYRRGDRPLVLSSAVEHPSVLSWADRLIPVDCDGIVDLAALDAILTQCGERIGVVSVMAANNETGVLQPLEEVAERVRAVGACFHCDATQVPGRMRLELACADAVTLSAHKFGGPRGVGSLVCREPPPALLKGGPQERGARAGTPNVPGIVGMGVAAARAGTLQPDERDRLEQACIALGGRVLGRGAPRLPNTLSVLFPISGDMLVIALDLEGIAASTGSACSSGASKPSHVVQAMGIEGTPVRFSLGEGSRVAPAIAALERIMSRFQEAECASSLR